MLHSKLKQLKDEEIVQMIKEGKIKLADIIDSGICPNCFDKKNNNVLFGNITDRIFYEDDKFECFLVGNPRANGHAAISTKKHYKNMMEVDDDICSEIFILAKRIMNYIKEIYSAKSIYLRTMYDGPMNHFHILLIPRYSFENRGSQNLVKPRFDYIVDKEKIEKLRDILKK